MSGQNQDSTSFQPAPWELRGSGFVFVYHFPSSFAEVDGAVPPDSAGHFKGGFGAVIIADYTWSPVGPYREVLLIPGSFNLPHRRGYPHSHMMHTVSRILVSSHDSVQNGRRNWGLPKEYADFHFEKSGPRETRVHVSSDGRDVLDLTVHEGRIPVPIDSALFPVHFFQDYQGRRYFTSLHGKGVGHLAKIRRAEVTPSLFPDFSRYRPFAAVALKSFHLKFPVAQIVDAEV